MYSSSLAPGLLETERYAAAVLGISATFRELPLDDSAEVARARVNRSSVIREPGHRFVLLVEEAALHYWIADTDAMAAQLVHWLQPQDLSQSATPEIWDAR